jgi:hypothetical protein
MKDTRVRILEDLRDWSQDMDAPRIFWLDGMAGTGKSAIAREFSRMMRNDQLLGGTFFCSRRGVAEQVDVKRILPTLCASLVFQDAEYKHSLLTVLDNSPISASTNLDVQFEVLLEQPLSSRKGDPPSLVLIIDALDECSDENSTRDLLAKLISISPKLPLKFFLTSRPEPHIRAQLSSLHSGLRRVMRLHDIEQDIVEKDISLYLTNRLRDIRVESPDPLPENWPPPSHVVNVTRHAGKLFIYAFTAVEYVRDDPVDRLLSLSGREVEAGKPLTKYLDDIYTRVLDEAMHPLKREPAECSLSKRILLAILTLKQPLTVSSLAALLHILPRQIRSMLGRLHAVVYVPREDEAGFLSTFHASFGDFLTDPRRASADVLLHLSDGHKDLGTQCIALMSETLHFNLSRCPTSYLRNSDQQLAEIPAALQYACLNIPHHLSASPDKDIALLLVKFEEVFSTKFLFWVEALSAAGQAGKASSVISETLTSLTLVGIVPNLNAIYLTHHSSVGQYHLTLSFFFVMPTVLSMLHKRLSKPACLTSTSQPCHLPVFLP